MTKQPRKKNKEIKINNFKKTPLSKINDHFIISAPDIFFKPNPTSQALLEKSSIGQTEREEKAKERGEA